MRKLFFLALVAAVMMFSGCDIASSGLYKRLTAATSTNQPTASSKIQEGPASGDSLRSPDEIVIVLIKDGAFVPAEIRVSSGTQVRWVNEDDVEHRVASNPCPMHSELPAMTSLPLKKGDAHNFIFSATGTIGYHDHLNPSILGKVIIE